MNAHTNSCSIFTPFHGTPLRNLAIEKGYLKDPDIIAPTNIPSTFNVNQIKFILLGLTPISVFAFMIVHTARRVFTSPIENENVRVVKKSFKAPTFKERFRETFLESA